MKHSEKKKLALRIGDKEELKRYGKGLFDTTAWEERKVKIADRVKRKEAVAKAWSLKKKEQKIRLTNGL